MWARGRPPEVTWPVGQGSLVSSVCFLAPYWELFGAIPGATSRGGTLRASEVKCAPALLTLGAPSHGPLDLLVGSS